MVTGNDLVLPFSALLAKATLVRDGGGAASDKIVGTEHLAVDFAADNITNFLRPYSIEKHPSKTDSYRSSCKYIRKSAETTQQESFEMIRNVLAIALLATSLAPAAALAQSVTVIAAAAYSTTETDIGTLLDDPASKAVLDKVLPGFSTNPQIDMARPMTMKSIQQYAADTLTDEKLAAVDAEFAKLPPKQ